MTAMAANIGGEPCGGSGDADEQPPGAWPFIGHLHLLGGQSPVARTLGAIADKHGPIFSLRLGTQQALVVSNWELIKECFTTRDRVFATRPIMAISKYLGYKYAAFALAPYGPYWRDVRKMVTLQLFTTHRLDKLRHVCASELNHVIKTLYSLNLEKVTLNTLFEGLTFNISIRMLAGKRFSSARIEDLAFKEAIKKALYLSGVFVWSDAIPSIEWMDIGGHLKSVKQNAKEIDKVLEDWVENRIRTRKENSADDFLDVMLSTLPENEMVSGYTRETVIKATLLLTLARLLQGFNISTPMGVPVDMEEGLGIALPKLKPLEVILTPRLPRELYEDL
ncbi:hypothetical protein BUALT_Bualt13G0116800 [Buddleja alternifolia]|uniref:Cytochrome P450 n=2 Tax=Buddleja alternifolia TaxID=168488 RepID=A0AAV6WMK0_9LAMI|nr:hypothetical protein BUALT_Bualt13G0116800 [Buddleja alternifolia]